MLNSYAVCKARFKSCRNPVAGKPIHGKDVRLLKYKDEFHIVVYKHHLATITPNDVITFHPTIRTLYGTGIASSLVYKMHRFLPLYLVRVGQGRYRINAVGVNLDKLPEYFDGIQFNLRSGRCLNPRPDAHTRINKDARKVWLRDLRQFKKNVLVRFKLGLRGDDRNNCSFSTDELLQWIRNNECPDTLINYITLCSGGPSAGYKMLSHTLDSVLGANRLYLRTAYGVFDDAA